MRRTQIMEFRPYFRKHSLETSLIVLWLRLLPSSAEHAGSILCMVLDPTCLAQSRPTLCNPMNCSTPGLPVHHQLPEFTQTHVHPVSDAIQKQKSCSSLEKQFSQQLRSGALESDCWNPKSPSHLMAFWNWVSYLTSLGLKNLYWQNRAKILLASED